MIYDTNIISIQSTTDAKNSNFDKKSKLLSDSIYQYLDHIGKQYEGVDLFVEKQLERPINNEFVSYSALWNQDINTNATGAMRKAEQANTMCVAAGVNINDIKKIMVGIDVALDPASIQIEKEQTDIDVLLLCLLDNLQTELHGIYSLIKRVFDNVTQININLCNDLEINNYKKIVFEVIINDTVSNILNMEDVFYANLYNIGDKSHIEHFVLKCEKYEV